MRISPVIKSNSVQKELNAVFFPELLPVVFNDGGHVLDVTFGRSKQMKLVKYSDFLG